LFSPDTGIVDAHALVDDLKAEAAAHGADFAFLTDVHAIVPARGGLRVETRHPSGEAFSLLTQHVINAAGLWADQLAERAGLDVDALGLRQHFCKGVYFALAPAAPRTTIPLI